MTPGAVWQRNEAMTIKRLLPVLPCSTVHARMHQLKHNQHHRIHTGWCYVWRPASTYVDSPDSRLPALHPMFLLWLLALSGLLPQGKVPCCLTVIVTTAVYCATRAWWSCSLPVFTLVI